MRVTTRLRSLFAVSAALVLGACSTPSSPDVTDVPDVPTVTDAALDTPGDSVPVSDVQEVTAPDVTDVAVTDASDAATDVGTDVPAVSFQAMVHITMQGQNCQPVVAPDPMTLTGTVDVDNFGTRDIGPITASEGIFVLPDGTELARFAFAPITIPTVAHGAAGHASFTKTAGSLMPASGCSAVPCGSAVISGRDCP